MATEDPRDEELSALTATYPEIQQVDNRDQYNFSLEVPVKPAEPVAVFFRATTEGQDVEQAATTDSHQVAHLPALHLVFSLPPSYPAHEPPSVAISTTPSWLPLETAKKLEDDALRLWEEFDRDQVLFAYIDHVQQSADDVFGLVGSSGGLEISPEHKIAILDYDIKAKQRAFDKETFKCGVCLGTCLHHNGSWCREKKEEERPKNLETVCQKGTVQLPTPRRKHHSWDFFLSFLLCVFFFRGDAIGTNCPSPADSIL